MKAELRLYYDPTEPETIATVVLEAGVAVVDTMDTDIAEMLARGIMGTGGKIFKLEDGEQFIRELPVAFSGSLLRAGVIDE